jgi:hypothetical protein
MFSIVMKGGSVDYLAERFELADGSIVKSRKSFTTEKVIQIKK